ncbi:MAG: NUDIX domain-containing protein [bacterium]|nr:NUDIX domain-containing protein [bacterium]
MPSRHYVTGAFSSHAQRLDDETYATVLDNIVVSCVDCVLVNSGQMLLGKRSREPQPDWWVIGGRMLPGESFETAAVRHCRRELSLEIPPERFTFLAVASQVFARRAQLPQENGCHTVAVTMTTELTDAERAALSPNDEYRAVAWRDISEVATDGNLHKAIRDLAADLIRRPAAL